MRVPLILMRWPSQKFLPSALLSLPTLANAQGISQAWVDWNLVACSTSETKALMFAVFWWGKAAHAALSGDTSFSEAVEAELVAIQAKKEQG